MPRVQLAGISSEPAFVRLPDEPQWSPQQLAIFAAVEETTDNLVIRACAGTGKTTVLVGACKRMDGRTAFLAFNKKIADEIAARVALLRHVKAGTFHSFGFAALRTTGSPQVNGQKLGDLQSELRHPYAIQAASRQLTSLAKQAGFGTSLVSMTDQAEWERLISHYDVGAELDETQRILLIECSAALLQRSNIETDVIDFDDMLYLPLLHNLAFPLYDFVLVDEAQDTNAVRREVATRMLHATSRLIAVGDERQAIYGFTGADAEAFETIKTQFSCRTLPLTVTYRCPQAVVRHAQTWVPEIEAAPTAPEGILRTITAADFRKLEKKDLDAGDAVLCRYTKPCVAEALACIRRGIGARVEGRDIGQSLVQLTKKWKAVRTLDELETKLLDYERREIEKARAAHNELAAAVASDKVQTLLVIMDGLAPDASIYDLQRAILDLFGDTQPGEVPRVVVFSTVHKAKGREWPRVYILGRETFMPSSWATQEWQLVQERNLIYVAVTRAKHELIEVDWSEEKR